MGVVQCVTDQFKQDCLNGRAFSGDTIKIALYLQASATLDKSTTAYTAIGHWRWAYSDRNGGFSHFSGKQPHGFGRWEHPYRSGGTGNRCGEQPYGKQPAVFRPTLGLNLTTFTPFCRR